MKFLLNKPLAIALLVSAAGGSAWAALPPGWGDEDIGAPGLAGSASYSDGVWTVSGGGTDIWGTSDQFNYLTNTLTGDGAVMARVIGQTATDPWAQAGIMIRNDSTAGAPQVSVMLTPGNGVTFRYRITASGTTSQTYQTGVTVPEWVRLSRSSNVFTASYSVDGIKWTQLGTPQSVTMGGTALAGLAVTAHNNSLISSGSFTSVLIVPGAQAGPQTNLINPYIGGADMAWQTTWPLPQLNVAGNALTPRMGWNSWFVVGDTSGPSESLIKSTADALVASGLAAAGYNTVVIDCTWIASGRGTRATNGDLIVTNTYWPDGMQAVANYVHADGLLMGGYTDIGASGYGSPAQIGAYANYQHDADQFASWGWDFIKIDDHGPGDFYAAAYAITHNSSGRPIALSLSTPQVDRMRFASRIANSWRVNNDISFTFGTVSWSGIMTEFNTVENDWFAQAPGHWNDPDMLCTGMYGISDTEGRSHFNMWAILGAPLMLGTDVRTTGGAYPPPLSQATLNTLTNREVIAVDQDPLGAVGTSVAMNAYAKPLGSFTSGQYAVLLLNTSSQSNSINVNWSSMGLAGGSAATVRDLWAHQNLGTFTGGYTSPLLAPHDSMMLIVTGTFDWNRPRVYEAESGYNTLTGTAYFVPENANFSSGAYVTGVGLGTANALQFNNVSALSSGLYEVDIYYACNAASSAQCSVNGGAATTVSFPSTGGATSQVEVLPVYLTLNAGENTLLFANATNVAPNFDKIIVSQGAPSGLAAAGGAGQVQLTWTAPVGDASFNVYRGPSSGGEAATPIATGLASPMFTDTNVINGQTYFYTVTGINPALGGESPPSVEASAKPVYATSSFAYQNAVVAAEPIAYWRLNETNGTVAYDSMGVHNATYGSAVTLGAAPRPAAFLGFPVTNTAAQFSNNVNNSWITIPALNLNANNATFTAWIYPLGSQADYAGLVFCRSGSTVAGMNYNSDGTQLGYTWNNAQSTWGWNSGLQPLAGQWSLVALVVEPSSAILYLINTNGQQMATNVYSNPAQAFAGTGTIGTDTYSSAARVFNGLMDQVAVFDSALTAAQIQGLYENGHQLPQVQVALQTGPNLNLTWPQGTLLQSTNLTGPWSALMNATSPFTIMPTNTLMFYRVLLQQ